MRDNPRRVSFWRCFFLIPLGAFLMRMVSLPIRPLWYDEAFALLYSSLTPERMIYGTVTPVEAAGAADVHPLLYYFLLHGWMKMVGQSPFAARFLSVILGMITVALLWRLAKWCFGARTGLVVGLLMAVNPFHVAYSQEARMYALLGLTGVTSACCLLRALEENRRRWWAGYACAAALMLYAHNLGAFILLGFHVLALSCHCWWRRLPTLVLADVGALVLFGPWLVGVLPGQLGFVDRGYWLSRPGPEALVRAVMWPILTFYEPPVQWVLALGFFVSLAMLALLLKRIWSIETRARWFLLLGYVPMLALFGFSQWKPIYLERALLPAALLYLVAVGWLLVRGGLPYPLRMILAVLLASGTIGSLWSHYTYARFPRPPFREAVTYLEQRVEPGDAVVHTNKLTYFPMHVYAPGLSGEFLADVPGSPQDTLAQPTQRALGIHATATISQAVGAADRVWLIVFSREIEEAQALGVDHHALNWLEKRFAIEDQKRFNDLRAVLYCRERP